MLEHDFFMLGTELETVLFPGRPECRPFMSFVFKEPVKRIQEKILKRYRTVIKLERMNANKKAELVMQEISFRRKLVKQTYLRS